MSFSQISELSDLADRPLVGALTSRLQALHSQLQAFVEQVDNLGKPPADGRELQVEGVSPPASAHTSFIHSGDDQNGFHVTYEKVNDQRTNTTSFFFTPYHIFLHFS